MTQPSSDNLMTRIGATPGKLALIGVLAIVLAYVVISQLPSRKPPALQLVVPSKAPSRSTSAVAGAPTPHAATPSGRETKPWPQPDLGQIVALDPFAAPDWAKDHFAAELATSTGTKSPSKQQQDESLDQLREQGTAVVVIVNNERLALVGEKQIRVGDHLGGFLVKEITEAGIVLATEESSP